MSQLPTDLITTGQAAKLLSVTAQTIRNYAKSGKIRSFQIAGMPNGRIYTTRQSVEQLLRDSTNSSIARSYSPDHYAAVDYLTRITGASNATESIYQS